MANPPDPQPTDTELGVTTCEVNYTTGLITTRTWMVDETTYHRIAEFLGEQQMTTLTTLEVAGRAFDESVSFDRLSS